MSLRINTNIEALSAHRTLAKSTAQLTKSMEKLSTGSRINRAADDAAGLGISEKMRSQIRGLAQAQRNIQDGISLVQTAEGNLDEVHSMLQRVRELAVQYKNGSTGSQGQAVIQSEINHLASEINRIGTQAEFNGITLLDAAGTVTFQVGSEDGDVITVDKQALSTVVPAATFALGAATDLQEIDAAIDGVSNLRSSFGAAQNRLEHTLNGTAVYQENLTAAESRIRDVDMAQEMVTMTKNQILTQAGQAMLAQANQSPQSVLQLLKG
ncbi:flagellin [Conexibacter sp. SYSU D00693]|uniref:flagellin N-terminal helical domain-containing protein n=1 Tax=Conexibacter sp. SYSU D00693 TaxID=2812560 RepID=UPI00196B58F1|nr:flagellin [Conexibacter sp. SYSU D00693]